MYAFEITGADVLSTTAVVDVLSGGGVSGECPAVGCQGQAAALLAITDVSGSAYLQGPLLTESVEVCGNPNPYGGAVSSPYCFPTPEQSFTLDNQPLTVKVGDEILVQAQAGAGTLGPGQFSAYVDPQIRLDPSDPGGLNLVFSPGIQQPSSPPVSSVPEPSAGSLLVGATLGALIELVRGKLLRRRGKNQPHSTETNDGNPWRLVLPRSNKWLLTSVQPRLVKARVGEARPL
jgi:hypothetical protein